MINLLISEHQWLQFDLGPPTRVTGIVTRGQGDKRNRFVTSYTLSYSNDSSVWFFYKDDSNHVDPKVKNLWKLMWSKSGCVN